MIQKIKLFIQNLKANYQTLRFKRHIAFNKKYPIFTMLYDGLTIPKASHDQDLKLTYGEIDFLSFSALLSSLQPKPQDIFYDLGSGSGKACFTAALSFSIHRCIGIEILADRYALSQTAWQRAPKPIQQQVQFIHDDFLNQEIIDATIVFVNATGFFNQDMQQLEKYLIRSLKPLTKVVICSKMLNPDSFELINTAMVNMAYGPAHVNIFQKT